MSIADDVAKVIKLVPGGPADFVMDLRSPYKSLVGGMGSAKTFHLVAASVLLGSINAPAPFVFLEPTYSLIDDVALPAFEKLLSMAGVPAQWHAQKKRLRIGYGRGSQWDVLMRSGDKPQKIIGFEAGGAGIDEPGRMRPDVFRRVVQRVRHPGAKRRQTMLAGTPEGIDNWFYEVCEASPPSGMRVYRARTADNPFTTPEYLQNLRATLSEQQLLAYAEGRFVNLTSGSCYPSFGRDTHDRRLPFDELRTGEVVVGCDFNVDKMCWVIGVKLGDYLAVVDEVVGRNTNTYRQTDALVDALRSLFADLGRSVREEDIVRSVRVFTDATGRSRKTSANESDIAIMRSRGFEVIAPPSNPPIKDRVNTVEAKLRGVHGSAPSIVVDCARAVELAKSLQGQTWGSDGLPSKGRGESDLSGAPDALGYLCWGVPHWRASLPHGNMRTVQVASYT